MISEARQEAQQLIAEAKAKAQEKQTKEVDAVKSRIDKELASALATLDKERDNALNDLDSQVGCCRCGGGGGGGGGGWVKNPGTCCLLAPWEDRFAPCNLDVSVRVLALFEALCLCDWHLQVGFCWWTCGHLKANKPLRCTSTCRSTLVCIDGHVK